MLCPTSAVLLDCFSNVFYALAHVSIDPTAEHSKPAFNFKLGHYRLYRTIDMSDEMHSYIRLQQQIHDALRVQHPDWVEPNGNSPTCGSYESRLTELLGLSPRTKQRGVGAG